MSARLFSLRVNTLHACLVLSLLAFPLLARTEIAPVTIRLPEAEAWLGQRVTFFVELRARGSFAGTASFDLPQIPGSILIKVGRPVVSSQDVGGESWFVQMHEFALFSQRPGRLAVPSFAVRFASRDGFTGPATEVDGRSPGFELKIERPPTGTQSGFLVTTESLDVSETWDPRPGPAQLGAIFKRTVVQRAPQFPGMALAPVSMAAPVGIRVYRGAAATDDQLERGDFVGERRETLTYLMQKPGTFEIPALSFTWWNPKTEELQSKVLAAVTFEIAAPPTTVSKAVASRTWFWLLTATALVCLLAWQRRQLAAWRSLCWRILNPPDRVAARKLLRACRRHDAVAATAAWTAWRSMQTRSFGQTPELRAGLVEMQRFVFGPKASDSWRGDSLARAFSESLASRRSPISHKPESALPELNA